MPKKFHFKKSTEPNLLFLKNIGKTTVKKLNKIGILSQEEFLSRNPYDNFVQLLEEVDPTLCTCALAAIVGATHGVPWNQMIKKSTQEFLHKHPEYIKSSKKGFVFERKND